MPSSAPTPTPPTRSSAPFWKAEGANHGETLSRAVAALEAGDLVAFPTETVYGLGALVSHAKGLAALWAARDLLAGARVTAPSAWHAGSAQAVIDVAQPGAPDARRIISRLAPGPVTFVIELPGERLAAARHTLGAPPGALDDGRALVARVPAAALARELAARLGDRALVAEGVPGPGGRGSASEAGPAAKGLSEARIAVAGVIDSGEAGQGRPSAVVRISGDGRFVVEREGVYDRGYIQRRVDRSVLFVCTGNTCRSPMAQSIAQGLIGARTEGSVRTMVRSAGLGARGGEPMSGHAADAVRAMGFAPVSGGARGLSASAVDEADAVYVMTRSHLAGVLDLAPEARGKVYLLDPRGQDIADPIGGPAALYSSIASSMRAMIERRVKELNA